MKTRGFTGLFILLPIAAICLFGYLGYKQYRRIEAAKLQQTVVLNELSTVKQLLAALENQPLIDKRVSAQRSEEEQANFLDDLRIHARNANVKVELFIAQAPAVVPANTNQSQEAPKTVRYKPMLSTVTVVGSYEDTRIFAFSIMQADRLMNMSSVKWDRVTGTDDLRLNFILTRYVTTADLTLPAEPPIEDSQLQANASNKLSNGVDNAIN